MSPSNAACLRPEESRVYLDFYELSEPPFAITPDPAFLYLSTTHQAALEKLLYGIRNRLGFLLLTGEVGTGKTTLCRHLLDLLRDEAETVYVINPALSGRELIAAILEDLGLAPEADATKKALIDRLNRYLLERTGPGPVVLIIDDAQAMPAETLEDLRLLSNLETDKVKLLQILLVGQPELNEQIGQPRLRQLQQRITLHCQLERLDRKETESYISRRLYASGNKGRLCFTPRAISLIVKCSQGIPRLINRICDNALVAGYVANDFSIRPPHIKRAIAETGPLAPSPAKPADPARAGLEPKLLAVLVVVDLLALALLVKLLY